MKNLIQTLSMDFSNENLVLGMDNGVLGNIGYDDNKTLYDLGVKIGELAFQEVNVYKNTILPIMHTFEDNCNAKIAEHTDKNPGEIYNIIEVDSHPFVKEMSDLKLLPTSYNLSILPKTDISLILPEDAKSLIEPSDNILKDMILNIFNKYSKDQIDTIFTKSYGYMSVGNDYLDSLFYPNLSDVDNIAIIYGIGCGIIKFKSINGVDIPDGYLDLVRTIVTNCTIALGKLHMSSTSDVTNEVLFYGVKPVDGGFFNVTVNKEIYTKFIEEGGSTEAVLGFIVNNNFSSENRKKSYFNANVKQLEDLWNNHIKTSVLNSKFEMLHKIRSIYSIVLTDLLNNVSDDIKPIVVSDVTRANNILKEILDSLVQVETLDVNLVSVKLFSSLTNNTSFGIYINDILELSKMNPDLTPQECASLALTSLIMDYLIKQVSISRLDIGTNELTTVFKG